MGQKAVSRDTYDHYKKLGDNLYEEPYQSGSQTIVEKLTHYDYGEDDNGQRMVTGVTKLTLFNTDVLEGHEHEEHWKSKGICQDKPVLMEGRHVK